MQLLMLNSIPHVFCEDCHRWEVWGTGIHTPGPVRAERLLYEYEHTNAHNKSYLDRYVRHLLEPKEEAEATEQPSHSPTKSAYQEGPPNAKMTQEENIYEKSMKNEDVLIDQCRTMLTAHFPDFTTTQVDVMIAVTLMIKRGG